MKMVLNVFAMNFGKKWVTMLFYRIKLFYTVQKSRIKNRVNQYLLISFVKYDAYKYGYTFI